jgi:L-aminopeptidase/D-esterase-like protein
VQEVHGVLLTGGSAYGLDAAGGVMRWLEERGHGFQLGPAIVPIVPAAVIFDLWVDDFSDALTKSAKNPRIRPDVEAGYLACQAASSEPVTQGNVGAGTGATLGKLNGPDCAMKGGIGSASLCINGVTVAALVVCNALGDVIDCWPAPAYTRIVAPCWISAKPNSRAIALPSHKWEATPPLAW